MTGLLRVRAERKKGSTERCEKWEEGQKKTKRWAETEEGMGLPFIKTIGEKGESIFKRVRPCGRALEISRQKG